MGAAEIEAFLTHLAVDQKVAASTQNQALSALLFLYRDVLRQELENSIDAVRARQPKHLPTVLTREEVFKVIGFLSGAHQLMVKLLYGSVYLPFALERKYPNANREWIWQYVFPASKLSKDPRSGAVRRHHLHETSLQKGVTRAARQAGLNKRVTCHTFRLSLTALFAPAFPKPRP